jgi:uncharacterized protein YdhG (YjbR/CyaY superfamily)
MPAFRFEGHVVAGFLATQNGCSYYPFSGTTLATLEPDVTAYDRTKSALHFDARRGLPAALVRKLLQARITETRSKISGPKKKAIAEKVPKRAPRARRAGA